MDSSETVLRIKIIQDIMTRSDINVLVAHNNYSYGCVTLRNKKELQKLIDALQRYIKNPNDDVDLEFKY